MGLLLMRQNYVVSASAFDVMQRLHNNRLVIPMIVSVCSTVG